MGCSKNIMYNVIFNNKISMYVVVLYYMLVPAFSVTSAVFVRS